MGDARLTPRQAEVARLYLARWATADIAAHLGVAPPTVSTMASRIRRLGVALPPLPKSGRPPRCDHALIRCLHRAGRTYPQIAAQVGVPVGTVRNAIVAARRRGMDVPHHPRTPAVPLPGGSRHPVYQRFRWEYGCSREESIAAARAHDAGARA